MCVFSRKYRKNDIERAVSGYFSVFVLHMTLTPHAVAFPTSRACHVVCISGNGVGDVVTSVLRSRALYMYWRRIRLHKTDLNVSWKCSAALCTCVLLYIRLTVVPSVCPARRRVCLECRLQTQTSSWYDCGQVLCYWLYPGCLSGTIQVTEICVQSAQGIF